MISNNPYAVVLNDHWIPLIIEDHSSFVKICCSETEVWKYENMSGKIRHLENICENISLRNRGKDFPYKKVWQTDTHTDRHSCLEKALLALKMDNFWQIRIKKNKILKKTCKVRVDYRWLGACPCGRGEVVGQMRAPDWLELWSPSP